MVRILSVLILFLAPCTLTAQDSAKINRYIESGVTAHDQGDYEAAIQYYKKALALDPENIYALSELGMTYLMDQQLEKAIDACKKAIRKNRQHPDIKSAYVTYGNALDQIGKKRKATRVFKRGIRKFPNFYMLHFNLAVTYFGREKYEDAKASFEKAVQCNPQHASSHYYLGLLLDQFDKRIPAVLAVSRFLILEPKGERAEVALPYLYKLMAQNVQREKDSNQVSIYLNPDLVDEADEDKPNNFAVTDMILSMSTALDYDSLNKNKTKVMRFKSKFDIICSTMKDKRADNHGFYWTYYAPYFIELYDKGHIEPFAYIVNYFKGEKDYVNEWLVHNQEQVKAFYQWSENYEWPTLGD